MRNLNINLVIPATFDECVSYEEQLLFLKKLIDDLADDLDPQSLREIRQKITYLESATSRNSEDIEELKEAIEHVVTIDNIEADASVTNTVGVPEVEVTKEQSGGVTQFNFAFRNIKGDTGATGPAASYPNITATASVNPTSGTPEVEVTRTGVEGNWNYDFAFSGLKGAAGPQGTQGVGISTVVLNADYTLTITLTNGDSYTTSSIRGAAGPQGTQGVGISTVVLNADYTLTITLTNGDSYTTSSIRGEAGPQGTQGVGISTVVLNADYTLTITLTNGDSYTTSSIRGAAGPQGPAGTQGVGISTVVLNADYTLTITLTNGDSYTTSSIRGAAGPQGPAGEGVPTGGTSGQVLTKLSSTDYDAGWQDPAGGVNYTLLEQLDSPIYGTTDATIDLKVYKASSKNYKLVMDINGSGNQEQPIYFYFTDTDLPQEFRTAFANNILENTKVGVGRTDINVDLSPFGVHLMLSGGFFMIFLRPYVAPDTTTNIRFNNRISFDIVTL